MNTTQRIIAIGAVVVFIGLVAYYAFFQSGSRATDTYESAAYGFSFEYPETHTIRDSSAELVEIQTEGGESVASVEIVRSPSVGFETLIENAAKATCASSCTDTAASQTFSSTKGHGGVIFYLNNGSAGEHRGPFFAFDISTPDEQRAILIYPASGVADQDVDALFVGLIADSIQFNAAEG